MKKEITLSKREEIQALQDMLIVKADGKNIEGEGNHIVHSDNFPLKHTFADGVYVRQMGMDKGSSVIGAIHNHEHVWFLLAGHISVATEDVIEDYIAPCYVVSTPGTKRVIHANEDSIFVNIHKNPSNTRDIKELENKIVSRNYEEYEKYINKKK